MYYCEIDRRISYHKIPIITLTAVYLHASLAVGSIWLFKYRMRKFIGCIAFVVILLACTLRAEARIVITVDKSQQRMSVSVDGAVRHVWEVSTGRANFGTPTGVYKPELLERSHFSSKYYNSPMPYSIFFHRGYAIHGSYEISKLGGPASHGCIRLHPQNAATLYSLVTQQGMHATTIVVSGENPSNGRRLPSVQKMFVKKTDSEVVSQYIRHGRTQQYFSEKDDGWMQWQRAQRY